MPDVLTCRWRCGFKVGRTIYAVVYEEPSDYDILIGLMDTPELALAAVEAHNTVLHFRQVTEEDTRG